MKRFLKYIYILLLIFTSTTLCAQSENNATRHKVVQGETLYGIARQHGVSLESLKTANPNMNSPEYSLKTGDVIVIPSGIVSRSTSNKDVIKVGVMLPFHDKDIFGKQMVEYYRGMLMACEYFKRLKYNIDVHTWNVGKSTDIDMILKEKSVSECDVIFGPYYSNQIEKVSSFANAHNIKLVIPFSIDDDNIKGNPQTYKIKKSPAYEYELTCNYFIDLHPKMNAIIIDCKDSKNAKGAFTLCLRDKFESRKVKYSLTSIDTDDVSFRKLFKKGRENVIILNSSGKESFDKAIKKINQVRSSMPDVKIAVLGHKEWLKFEKYRIGDFAANNVYIPTDYYYNTHSRTTRKIEADYFRWFSRSLLAKFPRCAIEGYDHAVFFIYGIKEYGKSFNGAKERSMQSFVQTPLRFKRVSAGNGYQNTAFMFIHYKSDKSIESIAY